MGTGKELGEIWGFRTDGIFRSNKEANAWATDSYHKNGSNFRAYEYLLSLSSCMLLQRNPNLLL